MLYDACLLHNIKRYFLVMNGPWFTPLPCFNSHQTSFLIGINELRNKSSGKIAFVIQKITHLLIMIPILGIRCFAVMVMGALLSYLLWAVSS